MDMFNAGFFILQRINQRSESPILKYVALLLCVPCFKGSHFCFKIVYAINQRRLRRLCGENFFLQFYDRPVAGNGIVNILQSLRHIKRGLEGAHATSKYFSHYGVSSRSGAGDRRT